MDEALALARRGWGQTAPNPLVGAVLYKDDVKIAEGFHARFGEAHAEAAAIADAAAVLRRLRAETGLAVVLISHDLSVVRVLCDQVAVMRQGEIVEVGAVEDVFREPQHPYTRKLLRAIPLPEVEPGWIDSVEIEEESV